MATTKHARTLALAATSPRVVARQPHQMWQTSLLCW
jgi:hypothetical protein